MDQIERLREPASRFPSEDVVKAKQSEGWQLAAIEWVRTPRQTPEPAAERRPIPYGLRISADCTYLEVDPDEKQVMSLIVAMIAGDHSLSKIGDELNRRGIRARDGSLWTQVSIFKMLPRIVEFGPEILSGDEWASRKKKVLSAVS